MSTNVSNEANEEKFLYETWRDWVLKVLVAGLPIGVILCYILSGTDSYLGEKIFTFSLFVLISSARIVPSGRVAIGWEGGTRIDEPLGPGAYLLGLGWVKWYKLTPYRLECPEHTIALPDFSEVTVKVSIDWTIDPDNLLAFVDSGEAPGFNKQKPKASDYAKRLALEEKLKGTATVDKAMMSTVAHSLGKWAASPSEGPKSWRDALQSRDEISSYLKAQLEKTSDIGVKVKCIYVESIPKHDSKPQTFKDHTDAMDLVSEIQIKASSTALEMLAKELDELEEDLQKALSACKSEENKNYVRQVFDEKRKRIIEKYIGK